MALAGTLVSRWAFPFGRPTPVDGMTPQASSRRAPPLKSRTGIVGFGENEAPLLIGDRGASVLITGFPGTAKTP